jgi:hypothetical protein
MNRLKRFFLISVFRHRQSLSLEHTFKTDFVPSKIERGDIVLLIVECDIKLDEYFGFSTFQSCAQQCNPEI